MEKLVLQKLEEIEDKLNYRIYIGLWRLRYDKQDYSEFIESDVKPLQASILSYISKSDTLLYEQKQKLQGICLHFNYVMHQEYVSGMDLPDYQPLPQVVFN